MKYLITLLLLNQACKQTHAETRCEQVHIIQQAKTCKTVDPALQSWETYSPNGGNQIFRLRVPCGWLVKVNSANTTNPIYVPDDELNWRGENYIGEQ